MAKLLSYMGYIELDYTKIEDEVMNSLDLDKNGKVDTDDIQELWNRTMKVNIDNTWNLRRRLGYRSTRKIAKAKVLCLE